MNPLFLAVAIVVAGLMVRHFAIWASRWWRRTVAEALIEAAPDRSGYTDAHVARLVAIKYGEDE